MATITGSEVLAQALRSQGVDTMFYLMGGPMLETEAACIKLDDVEGLAHVRLLRNTIAPH